MLFKASVHVDRSDTKLEKTFVCQNCGRSMIDNGSNYSTNPAYWTVESHNDDLFSLTTEQASCRETLYHALVSLQWYAKDVVSLQGRDVMRISIPERKVVISTLANGFWLGLTQSNNLWSWDDQVLGRITMPVDLMDWRTNCHSPMFSVCSYFFKEEDAIQRSNGETTNFRTAANDLTELIGLIDSGDYNQDRRADILRLTLRYFWDTLDYRNQPGANQHLWCKYAIVWYGLGGTPYMTNQRGFTYFQYDTPRYTIGQPAPKILKGIPTTFCRHGYDGRRPAHAYNGSLSFWSKYFSHTVDGRAVSRFVNGGIGMLPSTARKYMRYRPWE